jgi:hypothetical protein
MIAIGCYNYDPNGKEDSLIFNKKALEKGNFRAMSVKKYYEKIINEKIINEKIKNEENMKIKIEQKIILFENNDIIEI